MFSVSISSFALIRKTIPIYRFSCSSASPIPLVFFPLFSHGGFTIKKSVSISALLFGNDISEFPTRNPSEFPQKNPFHEPTVPREIPEISTDPEIDTSTPSEVNTTGLPPLSPGQNPGPDFPVPPMPSPPGPEFPEPPMPPGIDVPPWKRPDIDPPKPGPSLPEPEQMPPPLPEVVPTRPAGPEIVTSPSSSPDFVPPMGLFRHEEFT